MKKEDSLSRKGPVMDRRSFLRLSGILGAGLATSGVVCATAEAVKFDRKTYKVSRTRLAMGTFVSMTLIHPSRDRAQEAMGRAFEEIDRLSRTLNRFDASSAVALLNRESLLRDADPVLSAIVARSIHYNRITGRAFDITVKPVVDLFQQEFKDGMNTPPDEARLMRALEQVGSEGLRLKGRSIRFVRPGMGITLDGIAKGYIVDQASRILAEHGVKNHLINAGGDIRTMGHRQDRKPWTVAIQDPQKKKHYPDIIRMNNGAVATSGNYEVYYDREKMFYHIVNPRTGLSPALSTSVSVLSRTAMDADALSTSVFIMNPAPGTRFIDSLPGREALVIDRKGRIFRSSGWRSAAI